MYALVVQLKESGEVVARMCPVKRPVQPLTEIKVIEAISRGASETEGMFHLRIRRHMRNRLLGSTPHAKK